VTQQINLYNSALLPQVDAFSGRVVVLALGGILLLSLLAYGWSAWDATQLAAQQQQQQGELNALQSDITRLAQQSASHKPNPQLTAELQSIEALLAGRNEVMTVLKGGSLGDTKGVSEYFRAFARETVDGLWLTGFSIVGAGNEISIEGRALRAELVPGYIGKLRREDVLRGHGFGTLKVQLPAEGAPADVRRKTAEFLEFRLSSQGPGSSDASHPGAAR
jgi:hypothetical protein